MEKRVNVEQGKRDVVDWVVFLGVVAGN